MPFWVKVKADNAVVPVALGPFDTQQAAEAAQTDWQNPPPGNPSPTDPGEIVEADLDYRSTLPHVKGKVAINDVDHIVYTDGTLVPVE